MYRVTVQNLLDNFNLENLTKEIDIGDRLLSGPEVNRPALQLAGFFEIFPSDRVQILGNIEIAYMDQMGPDRRREVLGSLFEWDIPCFVVCRDAQVSEEFIDLARASGTPVLSTNEGTSDFTAEILKWLKVEFAPRTTVHGVLVDVYGEGILIIGESGIGKSETALELVKRGHRLVADDSVEIKKVSKQTLVGSCPEIIRYLIELRGIGIVDIRQMFGVASVKLTQNIDLVVKLESWVEGKGYDRLGLFSETMEFLGNSIVCHNIPVRPGRNLAIICESAAINHRLKRLGYNAAQELSDKIAQEISEEVSDKVSDKVLDNDSDKISDASKEGATP